MRFGKRTIGSALAALAMATVGVVTSTQQAHAASTGYAYRNMNSYLCMSVNAPNHTVHAGAGIIQNTCGYYYDQIWAFNFSASHPGWFYIQPTLDNTLCITYVPGRNDQLTLQNCGAGANNGNTSTMLFQQSASNNYAFVTPYGWAISIPGANTSVGMLVNIWPYGNYPDQSWSLTYI